MASVLSRVTSLASRIMDSALSPFSFVGLSSISVSSFYLSCVEIKARVISVSLLISTNAGLFLVPDKSVNGNGISTISPFFINISVSDPERYINLLLH